MAPSRDLSLQTVHTSPLVGSPQILHFFTGSSSAGRNFVLKSTTPRMETVQKAAAELGKSPGAAAGTGIVLIPPLLWPQQTAQQPATAQPAPQATPQQQPQVAVSQGQQQQGIVCPQCGYVNPPGAKFCINCGYMLGKKCPQCGYVNPPDAKFCANCGTRLT